MEDDNHYQHKFYIQKDQYPVHGETELHTKIPLVKNTKTDQIDELVALKLQHLRAHYADEEQRYIDKVLIENPIVIVRRPATISETAPSPPKNQMLFRGHEAQSERAESCRNSRYNNKIKKAKLRFRHKFVYNQLTENARVLDCMREVIAHAESQLMACGYNQSALKRMRQSFGVENCRAESTTNTAENNHWYCRT